MILLPAIDMKDGRCVRLRKGDFDTVHQVSGSALATARDFAAAGAKWVHMVDLDGARDGVRKNFPHIYQVIQESALQVELGGGIKNELDVISLLKSCVSEYGQTLVMITHDETIAQMADRMILIEDGRVVSA